jgi:hypothetical protein
MKISFLAALPCLIVAALPLAPSTGSAAAAATRPHPEIQAGLDEGTGSGFLSLTWKLPVSTRSNWENRELTLHFSRPLADAPIADLGVQLASAVETIRYGYDSMLVRLSPGFEPEVTTSETGVVVTLNRRGAEQSRPGGQSRLDFMRAKALLNSGEAASARAELQRFIADVPVPPDIARAARVARTEGSSGNIWRSFSTFDRMLRNDPGNPVLLAHYATVLIDNGKLRLARNVLDY